MKELMLIAFTTTLAVASPSKAEITCKRIGSDPDKTEQQLVIDGDKGAYIYNAYDGSPAVVEVKCGQFRNDADVGYLCERVFQREDGFTTEHYLIRKATGFTSLSVTTFVENSKSLVSDQIHQPYVDSFAVSCSE